MKPETPEAAILREIHLALGRRADVRLFRNTVGVAYAGRVIERTGSRLTLEHARTITHGLAPGSPDLVGWVTLANGCGVFLGVEVKAAQGRLMVEQSKFLAAIERAGGIAICARSADEAEKILDSKLRECLDAMMPRGV
jgi:hypothetical protein